MTDPRMITLTVTGLLFEFASFIQWKNKARSWYVNSGIIPSETIAVDSVGRVCSLGKHYRRADAEGTFPVKVYAI